MRHLKKSLGRPPAISGVLISAIAPAVISASMDANAVPDVIERLTSMIPMRRLGIATEAAELIPGLASEECGFSTKAGYDLSGGRATC